MVRLIKQASTQQGREFNITVDYVFSKNMLDYLVHSEICMKIICKLNKISIDTAN